MQKLVMSFVNKIDMVKKMERVTITTLKDPGHQIQRQKMKKPMKEYLQRMVLLEEKYLMRKL